jgi:hypothetical protein
MSTGHGDCVEQPWWPGSLSWVTRVMGRGNVNALPPVARDRRYYYYWFGVALTKYMRAYGEILDSGGDPTNPAVLTPDIVAAEPIDLETLFFDNSQAGSYDTIEYVALETIDPNPPAGKEFLRVPLDFAYGSSLLDANQRYTSYYRRFDREEDALYRALLPQGRKNEPPASNANQGVNLTNMFGSSMLASIAPSYQCAIEMWAATSPDKAPSGLCTKDAMNNWSCPLCKQLGPNSYSCPTVPGDYGGGPKCDGSTGTAGPCCGAPPPPLDPVTGGTQMDLNGQVGAWETKGHYRAAVDGMAHPWLWQYPSVWGNSIFSRGHSAIQVQQTDPKLEGAIVTVPNFLNPWAACGSKQTDGTGATTCDPSDPTYASPIGPFIMPWLPAQPGSGFSIPINGTTDKAIVTNELLFEGVLETYAVDYLPWTDPLQPSCEFNGGMCNAGYVCQANACVATDQSIQILAIESHDFLGEVFPCQDQNTGDVLHLRMYDSAAYVLDWLAKHPGVPLNGVPNATDACNIVVRYSPFNNYPDAITSLTNGVKVSINPGQGLGRIVDATLFDPAVETL